eukprot:5039398-Pleurochrysis_carterae.AAC.1
MPLWPRRLRLNVGTTLGVRACVRAFMAGEREGNGEREGGRERPVPCTPHACVRAELTADERDAALRVGRRRHLLLPVDGAEHQREERHDQPAQQRVRRRPPVLDEHAVAQQRELRLERRRVGGHGLLHWNRLTPRVSERALDRAVDLRSRHQVERALLVRMRVVDGVLRGARAGANHLEHPGRRVVVKGALAHPRQRLEVVLQVGGVPAEVAEEDDLAATLQEEQIVKHRKDGRRGLVDRADERPVACKQGDRVAGWSGERQRAHRIALGETRWELKDGCTPRNGCTRKREGERRATRGMKQKREREQ